VKLSVWHGAQKAWSFSQQVFVLYILYFTASHYFHFLNCSQQKLWVKESRTLNWPKWTNEQSAAFITIFYDMQVIWEPLHSKGKKRISLFSIYYYHCWVRDKRSNTGWIIRWNTGVSQNIVPNGGGESDHWKQGEKALALSWQKELVYIFCMVSKNQASFFLQRGLPAWEWHRSVTS
jgi:hypothetical protein